MIPTQIFHNHSAECGEQYYDDCVYSRELESLTLGKKIATGSTRTVYEWAWNDKQVVKVEEDGNYQNIVEWETWERLRLEKSPLMKWLARCVCLSRHGRLLVQDRTEPLRPGELPKRVPACLSDLKPNNFGWFEGRVVCHDYGTMLARAFRDTRLIKTTWD